MAHFGPHLYSESDPEAIVEAATEVFEIDDFTSPSDWEKFVAQVEHLIREWGLDSSKNDPLQSRSSSSARPATDEASTAPWRWQSSTLTFYDFEFLVTWHYRRNEPGSSRATSPSEEKSSEKDESEKKSRGSTPDPIQDMMKAGPGELKVGPGVHPLHHVYGLNEFVTFVPNAPREREDIDTRTRAQMALSTLTVALHNTNCRVPFFVQVMERHKAMFTGVYAGGGVRTNFDMIVLTKRPAHLSHLSGLLSLFKGKISPDSIIDIPSVRVTARLTYFLNDWTSHAWSQAPPDLDMFSFEGGDLGYLNDLARLPFGSLIDPVKRLVLNATWTDFQEEMITDSDAHTDLDPMEAPAWSVAIQVVEKPISLLNQYLIDFLRLCDRRETVRQLLGDLTDMRPNEDESLEKIPNVFNRLTGDVPSGLSDFLPDKKRTCQKFDGPIKSEYLSKILDFLFPDSSSNPTYPYPKVFDRSFEGNSSIKSAPVDGIVWRLSIVLAHCLHVLGGIRPFAHLMHEFMLELRFRWENGHMLPGLPPGPPDHAYGLFHQKLQMLNCCIEKKLQRETQKSTQKSNEEKVSTEKSEDSDEDEFFDCDDEDNNEEEEGENEPQREKQCLPQWSKEAAGRLHRLRNLRLLEYDDWLYVPHCQDPTPMTEDMLAEQAEVLLQLGMDSEGAELRAKMQSASLLSDMESFKAANPGSVLADFVRWHSPRDWEEGGGRSKGKLSGRMEIPGNIWLETWENAKPVPARRQKRLFDDTREAEKVIQFLTQLRPADVAMLLSPTLLHAAVHRVQDEKSHLENVPHATSLVEESVNRLSRLSRLVCSAEVRHYKSAMEDGVAEEQMRRASLIAEVVHFLQQLEYKASISSSLNAKFLKNLISVERDVAASDLNSVHHQLTDLVTSLQTLSAEVQVLGGSRGPAGQMISRMFYDAQRAAHFIIANEATSVDDIDHDQIPASMSTKDIFPKAESKEFILRTFANRPFPYSASCPQRLYAKIRNHDFRLAGAFSIDKQFL